jgi:hypothetical protein
MFQSSTSKLLLILFLISLRRDYEKTLNQEHVQALQQIAEAQKKRRDRPILPPSILNKLQLAGLWDQENGVTSKGFLVLNTTN